jgi:hypothetical protein
MSVGLFVVVLWWGVGWLRADVYAACSVCVGGLSWGDVDSCRDVPQYKVMKYLVFGIISSSLLSELQVMISKVECDGVCICMVYPTLWPGGTAECVYRPPLRLVPSVLMSVRFLWLCRLPVRNFLGCVFCWISYWLEPLSLKGSCVYSTVKGIRSPRL